MRRGDVNGQVTLVAMPASGEVFIARDDGVLWLVSPPGAGGPERVDEEIVERAVAHHGFERIEQDFDGWAELDAERQRRAGEGMPEVQVDLEHLDAEDVAGLLGALERARDRGQVPLARRAALRLLTSPVVRQDDDLYGRVLGFLEELDASATASTPAAVAEPKRQEARERLRLVA